MAEYVEELGMDELPAFTASYFPEPKAPPAQFIYGAVVLLFAIIGIPSNILAACVWLQRRVRNSGSSAVYLAALCITCAVRLLISVGNSVNALLGHHYRQLYAYPGLCEIVSVLQCFTYILSPALILTITVDLFIAIKHPQQKPVYCTTGRAIIILIILLVSSFLLSSAFGGVVGYDEDFDLCSLKWGYGISTFKVLYWLIDAMTLNCLPICVVVINLITMRNLCKRRRSRTRLTTRATTATTTAINMLSTALPEDVTLPALDKLTTSTTRPTGNSPETQEEEVANNKLVFVLTFFFAIFLFISGVLYWTLFKLRYTGHIYSYYDLTSFSYVNIMLFELMHAWNLLIFLIFGQRFRERFISLFRCKHSNGSSSDGAMC